MIKWDISRRTDLSGLPYQLYVQYLDGSRQEASVQFESEPFKDVATFCAYMREILDGLETADLRRGERGAPMLNEIVDAD